MKRNIMFLGIVVLFVAGTVVAEEVNWPLFTSNLYAQTHKMAKDSVKNETVSEVMPKSVEEESTKVDINETKGPLFIMKEWLKDLSPENRAEFIGSLKLKGGRVAAASIEPLRRSLNRSQATQVLESLATPKRIIRAVSFENKEYSAPLVQLSELLKDVSPEVRNEFFDYMKFKNGAVVSVYIGGLRGVMNELELKEILESLIPKISKSMKTDSKALCGNGVCYGSTCVPKKGKYHCVSSNDGACFNTCSEL